MHTIEIISFSGCPTSQQLYRELLERCEDNIFKITMNPVYSSDEAEETGLFGTPTIKIDGFSYQPARCEQNGVYCRLFDTKAGVLPYPDIEDIIESCLGKSEVKTPRGKVTGGEYPVLLVSRECAFTKSAKNLWSKHGDEIDVNVHVIDIDEHPESILQYGVSGVPCLVYGPEQRKYGMHISHAEAKDILLSSVNKMENRLWREKL